MDWTISLGSTEGMGTATLVGIVFVILKFVGVIGWSWWWVTAPFWGPPALVLTLFLVGLTLYYCITVMFSRAEFRMPRLVIFGKRYKDRG
ncbi:MAG: hypothetical protein ACRESR_02260 [Gammaproteobacteria bacterium]